MIRFLCMYVRSFRHQLKISCESPCSSVKVVIIHDGAAAYERHEFLTGCLFYVRDADDSSNDVRMQRRYPQ